MLEKMESPCNYTTDRSFNVSNIFNPFSDTILSVCDPMSSTTGFKFTARSNRCRLISHGSPSNRVLIDRFPIYAVVFVVRVSKNNLRERAC